MEQQLSAPQNFFVPSNPMVSTFYEVSEQRQHSELVLAVWSCHHNLLSCNARFVTIFERTPSSLARISWPDLCGPTRNLPDAQLAAQIDESYDLSEVVLLTLARHEKLKLVHLSLRDGLTNACTIRVLLLSARFRPIPLLLTCAVVPSTDGPPDILWTGRSVSPDLQVIETDMEDLRRKIEAPHSQLVLVNPRRRSSAIPHPEHSNQFTFRHQARTSLPGESDIVLGARGPRASIPQLAPRVPAAVGSMLPPSQGAKKQFEKRASDVGNSASPSGKRHRSGGPASTTTAFLATPSELSALDKGDGGEDSDSPSFPEYGSEGDPSVTPT